ncbi:hypothetical protein E1293_09260 [Actinomadura darangshiensis]|uniref:Uncharacterized protein n=1 Tax=Actinomadura darangshiensis TaxID=705336 RepID=A0A4R5BLN4_9ACTN|nr:hypothetical protein [Actinomadura darangshiensis]TDD86689.1 hypothetical protein E1293_09260 [Actinomadura darangshiensis]
MIKVSFETYTPAMAWNIEVAAVRTADLIDAVPDVFGPAGTTMGFEDATSGRRYGDLCVAKVGDWVIVIDVACRLSGNHDYLAAASASTDLHLVRIADQPIALHYRGGQLMTEMRGGEMLPDEDHDGESVAMDHLQENTGLSLDEDLWGAKFTLFVLD